MKKKKENKDVLNNKQNIEDKKDLNDNKLDTHLPKYELLLSNIREIHKAFSNANDSVFKIDWKKIFPFNLFLPQVDYLRLIRVLKHADKVSEEQLTFLKKSNSVKPKEMKKYYQSCEKYIKNLQASISVLIQICEYKHSTLLKEPTLNMNGFNNIIKKYQNTTAKHVEQGAIVKEDLDKLRNAIL